MSTIYFGLQLNSFEIDFQALYANLDSLLLKDWFWLLASLTWILTSLLFYLLFQLFSPLMIILLNKLERIRDPKTIIAIGEKFRKFDLSSPQLFKSSDSTKFFNNKLWGFDLLPSPFGSLVILDQHLNTLESDFLFSLKSVESYFFKFLNTPFTFIYFVPSLGMVLTALSISFSQPRIDLIILFFLFYLILTILTFAYFAKLRKRFLLLKTIQAFNLKVEDLANIESVKKELQWLLENKDKRIHIFKNYNLPLHSYWVVLFLVFAKISLSQNGASLTEIQIAFPNKRIVASIPSPTKNISVLEMTAFSEAVLHGNLRKVVQLIGAGNPVNQQDPYFKGATPLLLAIKQADLEMVYLLLVLGAKLNERDSIGKGPLFYSIESTQPEKMIKYVRQGKLELNEKDEQGRDAFQAAEKTNLSTYLAPLKTTENKK